MELTTPSCTTPQKTIHLCPMPGTKDMLWDEQDGIQIKGKVKMKLLTRVQLCNPMDHSLPGFSVHGIFQARVPEWIAISFSWGSSQPRD